MQTARGHFFTWVIVDLHAAVRNNTERLSLFLPLVLPSELQYLATSRTLPTSPGLQPKSKHRADGYWTPLRGCEDILRGYVLFFFSWLPLGVEVQPPLWEIHPLVVWVAEGAGTWEAGFSVGVRSMPHLLMPAVGNSGRASKMTIICDFLSKSCANGPPSLWMRTVSSCFLPG